MVLITYFLLASSLLNMAIAAQLADATSLNNDVNVYPRITPSNADQTVVPNGKEFHMICSGLSAVTWTWFKDINIEHKVVDNTKKNESTLKLNITTANVGYYYCIPNTALDLKEEEIGSLMNENKADRFYLFVDDPNEPIATGMSPLVTARVGENVTIPCKPAFEETKVELFREEDEGSPVQSTFSVYAGFVLQSIRESDEGYYNCVSKNITWRKFLLVVYDSILDGEEPIISPSESDVTVSPGDSVPFTCRSTVPVTWTVATDFNGENQMTSSETEYNGVTVYENTLELSNIDRKFVQFFYCLKEVDENKSVDDFERLVKERQAAKIYLFVDDTTNPIVDTVESVISVKKHDKLIIPCKPTSRMVATTLIKDNKHVASHFDIYSGHHIDEVTEENRGYYTCKTDNGNKTFYVDIIAAITNTNNGVPVISSVIYGVISVVILAFVVCIIIMYLRLRRQRVLLAELKAAGLANFEEGSPDSINPELTLDEQADLLPYDRKYEFPREKLKLGKQLGAGAFGVVMKGIAKGILPYEEATTVAVKMVKHMADYDIVKALISELKIMVHLGQHLNVVNLLGAVTKDIAKREVMVIVEYCRFGNLHSFLVKNRHHFVDQITYDDTEGQEIVDPTILLNTFGSTNGEHSDYTRLSRLNINSVLNSGGEESLILSNSSTQPAWRSNYRMDDEGQTRTFTTTDLLCWAFQVARGMDYLVSRKVLHGDLAARNILLCDDNVVKICDFGLARSMYKCESYRKQAECKLPLKWLAIESISDQIFSKYSDVWSFGIVLWEIFSLGKTPYPGMSADWNLYLNLRDGYRMEKPDYATKSIYDIILSCWRVNPHSRPLFNSLERSLSKLLGNEIAEHYVDLNEPYLQTNCLNFTDEHTDFLSLMAVPDHPAPSLPDVSPPPVPNISPTNLILPNYVPMSPLKESPTSDYIEMHSESKVRAKRPEEIPVLKHSFSIDSGADVNTPDSLAEELNELSPQRKIANFFKNASKDYMNMPAKIVELNETNSISNFGYVITSEVRQNSDIQFKDHRL